MIDRVGTVSVSAASLRTLRDVHFTLEDGAGIGDVLVGQTVLDGVGVVWFECPEDADFPACMVYADEDVPDALDKVCLALGIDRALIRHYGP